jgi:hypothetical protein
MAIHNQRGTGSRCAAGLGAAVVCATIGNGGTDAELARDGVWAVYLADTLGADDGALIATLLVKRAAGGGA